MTDLKVKTHPAWIIGGNTMVCRICSGEEHSLAPAFKFSQHGYWTSITSEGQVKETAFVCSVQCSQSFLALVEGFVGLRDC
jgi:hypothetical protein